MSGFRKPGFPSPTRYKYIVNEEYGGKDKFFGGDFTYNDLLLAMGPDAKDYTDISQVARNFYSSYSQTLSRDLNPLYEMIASSGGIQDIDSNYVRWRVYGEPEREMISYGNPNPGTAECLGAGGFSFKVRVDYDWLKIGDLIAPIRNKQCIVELISEAIPSGGAYEYEVILVDKDGTFPVEYFKPGDYWIKLGALTSYLDSGQAGSIDFGMQYSYIEFEVPMTTMQWEYSVDEEAHLRYGSITVMRCDENNRPTLGGGGSLTNFIETEAVNQIRKETELYMIYGRSSTHIVDQVSGKAITTGPGLMQFMEQAQEIAYSPTSNGIDKMVSEIKAFWYDKIPVSQRKLMLYTGEPGLELFHNWIVEKFGNTAVMSTEDLILGQSVPFEAGRNGKAFGTLQFTKYYVPVFGEITVAHWPLLDNTRVNGVKMPGTYYPVSAFEFWAFDIGFGEPNIQMLTRSNKERSVYIPGMWSPFGAVGPNNPVFKQPTDPNYDGYKWRHRKSFGMVIMEPDRFVRFLPTVAG